MLGTEWNGQPLLFFLALNHSSSLPIARPFIDEHLVKVLRGTLNSVTRTTRNFV